MCNSHSVFSYFLFALSRCVYEYNIAFSSKQTKIVLNKLLEKKKFSSQMPTWFRNEDQDH